MDDTKSPDGLPEGWEAWLAYFAATLARPVEQVTLDDGSVMFRGGEPGEVIVHLTARTIRVSEFTVRYIPSGEPLVVARLMGTVKWRRMNQDDATIVVDRLVAAARAARRASFRTCEICDQEQPPEWMHTAQHCRSCAERGQHVVH